MIYVIDNGESWVDHDTFFIESEYPQEVVQLVIDVIGEDGYYMSKAHIICMANEVKWFEGHKGPLSEILHLHNLTDDNEEARPSALRLPPELIREVILRDLPRYCPQTGSNDGYEMWCDHIRRQFNL